MAPDGVAGPPGPRRWKGGAVRVATFTEPDALRGKAPWGQFTATPLCRYPFSVRLIDIDLDGVLLEVGRCTPLAAIGALPPDTVALLLPLDGWEGMLLNGRAAGFRSVAACGAGAEYEVASRAGAGWALVSLPFHKAPALIRPPGGSALRRHRAVSVLRADPVAWADAAVLVQEAAEVAALDPTVFDGEEARRALRAALLEAVHGLLAARCRPSRRPRPPRLASARRRELVREADGRLRADPAGAGSGARLSAAIGVPAARLQAAFAAVLGVGAGRYSLLRRLAMVRAALRSAHPHGPTVEDLALAHGFARLGSFRRAYRAMFGEEPRAH